MFQYFKKLWKALQKAEKFSPLFFKNKKNQSPKKYSSTVKIILNDQKNFLEIYNLLEQYTQKIETFSFVTKNKTSRLIAHLDFKSRNKETILKDVLEKKHNVKEAHFFQKKNLETVRLLIFGVIFLWGLEPVLVRFAYSSINIKPIEIAFIRFWFTAIPLCVWAIWNKIKKSSKTIPFFQKNLLFASLGAFFAFLFRYIALQSTTPSYFMVFYREHIIFTALFLLPLKRFTKNMNLFKFFIYSVLLTNAFLLLSNISWQAKIYSFLATFGFSILTVNSYIFLKKFSIKSRFSQFIALIYLYCGIGITLFAFFTTTFSRIWTLFRHNPVLMATLVAIIFIPYVFIAILNLKNKEYFRHSHVLFSLTWIVSFIGEMFILRSTFHYLVFITGILMTLSIYLLGKIRTKNTKESTHIPSLSWT